MMKAVHTVFDYVGINNKSHDRKVARSLSMWRNGGSDPNHCTAGRPPSLKALRSNGDYDKAVLMMKCLFLDYENIEGANSLDLQDVLFGTVLKHLESFLELLKEHPGRRFGETNEECFQKHRFLQQLLHGAANADIENPIETLLQWGRLIDADFHRRNFMFVSQESLLRVLPLEELGNSFEADSRSFYDHFTNSSRAFQQLHVDWYMVNQKVNKLEHRLEEQDQIQRQLLENQTTIMQQNKLILDLLQQNGLHISGSAAASSQEGHSPGASVTQQGPSSSLNFVTLPGLKKLTIKSIFLGWHRNQYYKLPIKSNAKKDKNTRFVIKTAIEYFTLFLDSHIDPFPENVHPGQPSHERSQWINQLEFKFELAWKKVVDLEEKEARKNKRKRFTNLELVSTFKKFMDNVEHTSWPVGPEGETFFQPPHMGKMKTRDELVELKNIRDSKNKKDE
jgi:hypothetical protein